MDVVQLILMLQETYTTTSAFLPMLYCDSLMGKSYCFVKPDTSEIVCAFTVANSSVKVDSLPSNLRNKLNRKIPNAKRRPQYPAVLVGQLAVSDLFSGNNRNTDKQPLK